MQDLCKMPASVSLALCRRILPRSEAEDVQVLLPAPKQEQSTLCALFLFWGWMVKGHPIYLAELADKLRLTIHGSI